MDQHDDGDGDTGEARAATEAEQAADDYGGEDGEYVVPGEHAEERKRKSQNCADDGAEDAIARGVDGGSDVGLENDDGADGAPVAIVEAEGAGERPAKGGGEGRFGGMDEETPALPVEEAGLLLGMNMEAERELLLRPGFWSLQAH